MSGVSSTPTFWDGLEDIVDVSFAFADFDQDAVCESVTSGHEEHQRCAGNGTESSSQFSAAIESAVTNKRGRESPTVEVKEKQEDHADASTPSPSKESIVDKAVRLIRPSDGEESAADKVAKRIKEELHAVEMTAEAKQLANPGWDVLNNSHHQALRRIIAQRSVFCEVATEADLDVPLLRKFISNENCQTVMLCYNQHCALDRRLSKRYSTLSDESDLVASRTVSTGDLVKFVASRLNRNHLYMHVLRTIIRSPVGVYGFKSLITETANRLHMFRSVANVDSSNNTVVGGDEVFFETLRANDRFCLLLMRCCKQLYFTPPTFIDMNLFCQYELCRQPSICPLFCMFCRKSNIGMDNRGNCDEFRDMEQQVSQLSTLLEKMRMELTLKQLGQRTLPPTTSAFLLATAAIAIRHDRVQTMCRDLAYQLHIYNHSTGIGLPFENQSTLKKMVRKYSEDVVAKSFVEFVSTQSLLETNPDKLEETQAQLEAFQVYVAKINMKSFVGFEPGSVDAMDLPITHKRYCTSCGTMRNKVIKKTLVTRPSSLLPEFEETKVCLGAGNTVYKECTDSSEREPVYHCARCSKFLVKQIWFPHLTELLTWSYLFELVGVPLPASHPCVTIEKRKQDDATEVKARPYRGLKELGKFNYEHQCYFVTHLILVASAYGTKRIVHPESFVEEIVFMSNAMADAIATEEVELVGEFCFCLKLLGAEEGNNMALYQGMLYLKKALAMLEKMRVWQQNVTDFEKRLHIIYCVIGGLLPINCDLPPCDADIWKEY